MTTSVTEREMLARLGLHEQAGPDEIEAAYSDLIAFLQSAPHDLRGWAQTQMAAADEAYALLSDPAAAKIVSEAPKDADSHDKTKKASQRRPRDQHSNVESEPARRGLHLGPLARAAVAGAVILLTLTAGYIVYASDVPSVPGLTGTPAPESTGPVLDTARIATLMQAISADAGNVDALQELGDIYFQAGDYATASEWENKVLAAKPDDVTAHLALGAAAYNVGDSENAEANWRRVLELDPLNVEAHYDLGFMYFSAEPPDVDKTIVEWQQVVAIAPESDVAQTVSTHLQTLEQWKSSVPPSAAATSSGSAIPTALPSALP